MKKLKVSLMAILLVVCSAFCSACLFKSVKVDKWSFSPAQSSGTEMDLSIFTQSHISFDFTIVNSGAERDLLADSFKVILYVGTKAYNAQSVGFDSSTKSKSITFASGQRQNITLFARFNTTFSNATEIVITYSGTEIATYTVSAQ